MRTGPGTSYTSVTSLSTGALVTIIGQGTAADGKVWYYTYCIKNGQVYSGYMSSTYIQLTSAKRTATKAVVDATDLNVRKGAGSGYDSITKIDRNNTLYILDTSLAATGQTWALVYFEKSGTKYVGYVLNVYIYDEMFELVFDRNPVDQMDDMVYHMTGNPAMVKKLTQTLEISGKKGDVFAGGVWSCGAASAAKDNRAYGLEVQFVALDGSKETFTSTFEAINSGWKYLYDVFIPTKSFVRINVSCVYNYQGNMVLFDGLGFYREDFAASYVYDNEGNVTSVKNNASK